MTTLLASAALTLFNLVILGTHAWVPWQLAKETEAAKRRWALAAAPSLLASAAATAVWIGRFPDAAAAQGFTLQEARSSLVCILALAFPALLLGDLLLMASWRKLEPAAWRLLACLGLVALTFGALAGERLRIGEGIPVGVLALAIGVAARCGLALAANELFTSPRRLTPLAGLALAALWPALAAPIRVPIVEEGTVATLVAASSLLLLSRWLPPRLRKLALAAGLVLAALFLARAAAVATPGAVLDFG